MGASSDSSVNISYDISSTLMSFASIKDLSKYLILNNNGELSKLFASLIKNPSNLDNKIREFKNMLGYNFDYSKDNIIKYILETLHQELNRKKNNPNWLDVFNQGGNNPSYEEFLKSYKENDDSIIQQLFFGIKEIILKCSTCKECNKNYEIMKSEKLFEVMENKSKIDIRDLIKRLKNLQIEDYFCQKCKIKTQHIINTNIIELPEIIIIFIDRINNDCIINYYLQCQLLNEDYNLICFISNKNEKNQKEEQNNVFYSENGIWYVYKTKENRKILIRDISKISGNPLIVFYQKNKTLFNKFYKNISLLLNDQKNTLELINEHIIPEIDYENYYLLNKDWFNKIIKIYEPENIYSNNEYIIDSLEKVTKATKSKIKNSDFNERIKIIWNENLFEIDYNNETNTKINYPKNFVLVNGNILNGIFKELNISTEKYKKFLYPVKFGENYLFIKNNKEEKGETIYVCFLIKNEFKVGIILNYANKECFNGEIKKYISNRGGLEYYFQERKLKLNYKKPQKIIDKETDIIGYLININSLNDLISPYKFNKIDDVWINGVGNNYFQMSVFEDLINLKKSTRIYKNEFSDINYGNNPLNQINMPDRHFVADIPTCQSKNLIVNNN